MDIEKLMSAINEINAEVKKTDPRIWKGSVEDFFMHDLPEDKND